MDIVIGVIIVLIATVIIWFWKTKFLSLFHRLLYWIWARLRRIFSRPSKPESPEETEERRRQEMIDDDDIWTPQG